MTSETLQTAIDDLSKSWQAERSKKYYTLGRLIKDLEALPAGAEVLIAPYDLYPTYFHSYRGYYRDLSLSYELVPQVSKTIKTVGELLAKAKECVGKTLAGWKGGAYTMDENTPIWLSRDGQITEVRLSRLENVYSGSLVRLWGEFVEGEDC